jgi:hypothetical protein
VPGPGFAGPGLPLREPWNGVYSDLQQFSSNPTQDTPAIDDSPAGGKNASGTTGESASPVGIPLKAPVGAATRETISLTEGGSLPRFINGVNFDSVNTLVVAGTPFTVTQPGDIADGDWGFLVLSGTDGAAINVSAESGTGRAWTVLVNIAATNARLIVLGRKRQAGDSTTISVTLDVAKFITAEFGWWRDVSAINVGSTGVRTVTSVDLVIPAITVPAGRMVLIAAIERTLATGTVVSSSSPTVAQRRFTEGTGSSTSSAFLGDRIDTDGSPDAVTLTYNSTSTNAGGVQIELVSTAAANVKRSSAATGDSLALASRPAGSGAAGPNNPVQDAVGTASRPAGAKAASRAVADSVGTSAVPVGRRGAIGVATDSAATADRPAVAKAAAQTTQDATTPTGRPAVGVRVASRTTADALAPTGRPTLGAKSRSLATSDSVALQGLPSKGFVALRPTQDTTAPAETLVGSKAVARAVAESAAPVGLAVTRRGVATAGVESASPAARPIGSKVLVRPVADSAPPAGRPAGRRGGVGSSRASLAPAAVVAGRKLGSGGTRSSVAPSDVVVRVLFYRDIKILSGHLRQTGPGGSLHPDTPDGAVAPTTIPGVIRRHGISGRLRKHGNT